MKIYDLQVNHLPIPMGYDLTKATFTYKIKAEVGKFVTFHQLKISLDPDFTNLVYNSGKIKTSQCLFYTDLTWLARTRYYWQVTAWTDGQESGQAASWFESGKLNESWQGQWITPVAGADPAPLLSKAFSTTKTIAKARLYITGLGLYEACLNGKKIGEEFFTPGYNNYDAWIQYQTYDVTAFLTDQNQLQVQLGKGWYKGRFGFHGGTENIYGEDFLLLCELHIDYTDGSHEVITTDDSWQASSSKIGENSIYYGEDLNDATESFKAYAIKTINGPTDRIKERLSLPVKIKEEIAVQAVLKEEELILDMGQNMVGWLKFRNTLAKGVHVKFEFAEILVNGQFYRENLRHARAAFDYTSDGRDKWVRPHFSFFGFRYVRITGWPKVVPLEKAAFIGQVLYSDMAQTGAFQTSDEKLNRLYQNSCWSQKGNFLETPTDCPQRDERMGWTGDAQIFSKTALYNMDASAFFQKYGYDMTTEQVKHQGAPTMTIPDVPNDLKQSGAAVGVWGDAATIIPWHVYETTGDKRILAQQYTSMAQWIEYVYSRTFEKGLWTKEFQFGDWLALDGADPKAPIGGTEAQYVANVYLLHSLKIIVQTSQALGKKSEVYQRRADNLKQAIRDEYFTKNGRLAIDTQTGYVLALYFGLVDGDEVSAMVEKLRQRLEKDHYHIQTGFVGTPLICLVLSQYGLNDMAYTLVKNEDYPSWLYAIDLGATTMWERWNSVLPDGTMNPQGMNSLNHYAYGAISQWFYEGVLGIKGNDPGFNQVCLTPKPHWSLRQAVGHYMTTNGKLSVSWSVSAKNELIIDLEIPFNTKAKVSLPYISKGDLQKMADFDPKCEQLILTKGSYHFKYLATTNLQAHWSLTKTTLADLLKDPFSAVRMERTFKDQPLLSSSVKRDHKEDSLAALIEKGIVSEKAMQQFINDLERARK